MPIRSPVAEVMIAERIRGDGILESRLIPVTSKLPKREAARADTTRSLMI
jgi:hypothetical protein